MTNFSKLFAKGWNTHMSAEAMIAKIEAKEGRVLSDQAREMIRAITLSGEEMAQALKEAVPGYFELGSKV